MTFGAGSVGHLQDGPTASRPTYRLVQVLRAVAALMVVAYHATIMLQNRLGVAVPVWTCGASGVDIFFVISGFVMTLSSEPLTKASHAARTFLLRRLERVVPMYWVATTLKIVAMILLPTLALNPIGRPWHLIASYLFIPAYDPYTAEFVPVLVVGWTLNYEVMFYLLFTLAFFFNVSKWKFPVGVLIVFGVLGLLFRSERAVSFYCSSLMLEFLFGMLVARWLPSVRRGPAALSLLVILGGFAVLLLWSGPELSLWRGVFWGLPATAVVAGILALERATGRLVPRWLLGLGDASYSIYLVHGFVLPALGVVMARTRPNKPASALILFIASLLASAAAGWACYLLVERPITRRLKGRRETAVPVIA